LKKHQVDHVLRAAGRITGEQQFIVMGSQSLHGTYPEVADEILNSAAVGLIAGSRGIRAEWLRAIGYLSPFHESFGYYADPIDSFSVALPKGWKHRLVVLAGGDTGGVRGLCLEPHDLAITMYVACREQDLHFNRELARRGLVAEQQLLDRIDGTPLDHGVRTRIRGQIVRDFRPLQPSNPAHERAAPAGPPAPHASERGQRS